jgi:hypothetical protein
LRSISPRPVARFDRSARRAGQPALPLATAPKLSLVQSLKMAADAAQNARVRRDPSARNRARA